MPAGYVIAHVAIEDEEAYAKYRAQVPATIDAHGGAFLARGGKVDFLEGGNDGKDRVVVIRFDSFDAAKAWYDSAAYQPLAVMRQAASSGRLFLVEGV